MLLNILLFLLCISVDIPSCLGCIQIINLQKNKLFIEILYLLWLQIYSIFTYIFVFDDGYSGEIKAIKIQ